MTAVLASHERATAVLAGLDYILARQETDGAWTDWALPPGPASHWTTAHVGYCLGNMLGHRPLGVDQALARAGDWLDNHRLPGGAWGYSDAVEPDADTTSLAVLFSSAMHRSFGPDPVRFLQRCQRPDGGFATFLPDGMQGAWGQSHAETTAITLLALRAGSRGLDPKRAEDALAWLRRNRRADGTWSAYWWTDPYLVTRNALACLAAFGEEPGVATFELPVPDDSLQAAHLLAMSPATSRIRADLISRLLSAQLADGSWAGGACLRVPPRTSREPWTWPERIPVYADPRRLFTTATVVLALARDGR